MEWSTSCNSLWAYQTHCYQWPPGEFLDLDSMTWVPSCDSDTQIEITNIQLANIPLWRSFTYFVDPLSESVTELGTYDHPYKDLLSVFVEMFNFHSHSDRMVVVKVHEDTTNYLMEGTYVINITQVVIESYSKVSLNPKKAKIVAVESLSAMIPAGVPSKFKLLRKNSCCNLYRVLWFKCCREGSVESWYSWLR